MVDRDCQPIGWTEFMALTGSRIERWSLGLFGAILAAETATDAGIPNQRT